MTNWQFSDVPFCHIKPKIGLTFGVIVLCRFSQGMLHQDLAYPSAFRKKIVYARHHHSKRIIENISTF